MMLEEFYIELERLVKSRSVKGRFFLNQRGYLRNLFLDECPICAVANGKSSRIFYSNTEFIDAGVNVLGLTEYDTQLVADAADNRIFKFNLGSEREKEFLACRERLYQICGVE